MGTEVASRPPLPPGLTQGSNSQGPARRRTDRDRCRPSSSGRPSSSSSSQGSGQAIYARDYHLRIQGQYSLSSAFVCIGAKIHRRYNHSPSLGSHNERYEEERSRRYSNPQTLSLPDCLGGNDTISLKDGLSCSRTRFASPTFDVGLGRPHNNHNNSPRRHFRTLSCHSSSDFRHSTPPTSDSVSSHVDTKDNLIACLSSHQNVPQYSSPACPQIQLDTSYITSLASVDHDDLTGSIYGAIDGLGSNMPGYQSHDTTTSQRLGPNIYNPAHHSLSQDTLTGYENEKHSNMPTSASILTEDNLSRHNSSIGETEVDTFKYMYDSSRIPLSTLEIRRGLKRMTLEHQHPTDGLEIVEQPSNLPHEFSHQITEAINRYQETPASSNRSSPTITEEIASSSQSIVQGDLWGGNTTERSSVDSQYSWDEFDRQAAKTVQSLFDEIDSVLFERRPNQAEYIYNECQEWGSQFPHLRILGRQLLPVQECGFEMIERDVSRPNTTSSMGLQDVTDHDLSGTSIDSQGLSVSGRRVTAIVPPVEARSRNSTTPSTHTSEFSHLEEEVFECEGDYEEIIAVDYRDIFEDMSDGKKVITPRRRQPGYPPITPNACLKDGVASSVFDCTWHEVISWIRPLLKRYSNIILAGSKPYHQSLQNIIRHESTPGLASRENSNIRIHLGPRGHTVVGLDNRVESPKLLDGVLQIVRKIPQQREASTVGESSDAQMSVTPARPVSSIPTVRRPGSNYPGGPKKPQRLAPIQGYDRSKTPSVDEERIQPNPAPGALLVKKIMPPGLGRLSSPPYNARNSALPPIGTPMDPELISRYQKKAFSRASSAVDKDLRVALKDRFMNVQDPRPSTTHAFRTETPQARRSSTPFNNIAFNTSALSRNSSFGTAGMSLDIRGSGLQPSHDQLANIPQQILEDHESFDEHIHANQWTPSTTSHNNPYYRRSHKLSSLVKS